MGHARVPGGCHPFHPTRCRPGSSPCTILLGRCPPRLALGGRVVHLPPGAPRPLRPVCSPHAQRRLTCTHGAARRGAGRAQGEVEPQDPDAVLNGLEIGTLCQVRRAEPRALAGAIRLYCTAPSAADHGRLAPTNRTMARDVPLRATMEAIPGRALRTVTGRALASAPLSAAPHETAPWSRRWGLAAPGLHAMRRARASGRDQPNREE